jgi:TonB-linked SusC/RagA family outer membrane protein
MKKKYKKNVLQFGRRAIDINLLVFLLVLFLSFTVSAQNKSVTGKIVDAQTKAPLLGVNVFVKNSSIGVVSDLAGNYNIKVTSANDVLVFSYVGYKTLEKVVGTNPIIDVQLEETIEQLDEMVIVGYGVQKKRNLTGSISSVSSASIENTAVKDVLSAMQGRAAGVNVVSNSGAPGDGISVSIRGQSSLNSGNSPLYVIDGIPVESSSLSLLNGWESHGLNPLADINPGDVESIEILKDGASTAIYGSRAANGVVLITTKRGKKGKAKISINTFSGFSALTHKLSVLNATQWRDIIKDSYKNLDDYNNATTPSVVHWTAIDSLNPMNSGDVDWQDVMYRTGWQEQLDFSVSGGNQDSKYAFSSSFLNQDGIVLASNYKRITSRLNTDFKISNKLKMGQSISFAHSKNNRINAGGTGNNSLVVSILVRPPIYSLTYPDGSPINYFNGKRNPVALAEEVTHLNVTNRILGSQYLEYEILKDLKFRTNFNLDLITMKEDEFYPTTVDYRAGYNSGAVRATTNFNWSSENYFTYDKTFSEVHDFNAMIGFSKQNWKLENTGLDGQFFASDNIRTLNGAGTISGQYVNATYEHGLASYYGRLSYTFKDKYIFQANMRADGSSRFGKNNRFGYFPSASAAWRFSDESFLADSQFINDGKLRFSFGQTGNEAIGDYTSQGQFSLGANYIGNSGAAPSVMPNSNLTWETTTQYNLGVDLGFLKNRISLNADFYQKNTEDLLFSVPIPETTGFNFITQNIGKIENKGFEFTLTTHNLSGEFKWDTSFNIGLNRNEIVSLPDEVLTDGFIQNGAYHILKVGESIGTFYGWKSLGVYSRDTDNVNNVKNGSATGKVFKGGDVIWDDLNGDNIIDGKDKQIIGNAQADYIGGFGNDFSYKNFSLNVFFQFSKGNDIYSNVKFMRNWVFAYNNVSTDALERWRNQGDVTNYPKPTRNDAIQNDNRVSDRWIEDGSYLKLKNVSFSYNFPSTMLKNTGVKGIRTYLTGQNLITWTHYTGYDPEVSSYSGLQLGVDDGSFPQSRTIILGLNVEF